jgi:general stress protein YciG
MTAEKQVPPNATLRGFAALKARDPQALSVLSSKGGKRAHELGVGHQFTSEEAKIAGRKGGARSKKNGEKQAAVMAVQSGVVESRA